MAEAEFYLEVIEEVFDLLEVAERGLDGTGGDMVKSVYDPTAVLGDAFDMDKMAESATAKVLTDVERTGPTQIEAETGTSTVTKLWSALRVRQAIVGWAVTAASTFKGILSGYTEAYGTIIITTGTGSLDHSTAENIQRVTLAANTVITITNPANLKALTLELAQTAGPWTLDISCNSLTLAITLAGVSGQPKEIVELWSDGTDMWASNGDGTWSKGV